MKYYWLDYVDDFLYEKSVNQGLSSETIRTFIPVFNSLFANPYINIYDFKTFTEINFKRLLWDLLTKNNWSSHTYNRYRKNLKIFCDYLLKKWFIKEKHNPLKNILVRKTDKRLPKYLTSSQVYQLKKAIDETYNTHNFLALRNKAILYFYLYTWCRLNELVNLKFTDLNFQNWTIRINKWKWNKDRLVPLVFLLSDLIIAFEIKKRKIWIKTDILFPSKFRCPLRHRDIYEILNKVKSKLDFHLTPHMFRHTFATELVRKNINLYNISKILWHSNVKTTEIYLWLDLSNLKTNLEKVGLYIA